MGILNHTSVAAKSSVQPVSERNKPLTGNCWKGADHRTQNSGQQNSDHRHLECWHNVVSNRPSRFSMKPVQISGRIAENQSAKQHSPGRDVSAVAGTELETSDTRCFLLWIDGVGVWQLLMGDHFVIGAPSSKSHEADLAIQANVRKQHASIFSEREDWILDPLAETFVGNQRVAKKAHLRSGDQIRLGESVELGFRLPSPLSHSAVLDFESGHRPLQTVDGVILLTDHCIVGPRRDQHVYCSTWQHSFVLFRRGSKLLCRSSGDFQFNGVQVDDVCEIVEDSMIESEHCRFRVEVIR